MSEPRGPTTEELRARALAQPTPAKTTKGEAALVRAAVDQIRDALEDEAQVALDTLDWLEARVPPLEPPLDERRAEHP